MKSRKERAIQLRRKGKTYSEILSQIPVAKSTLSIWLGSVGLTSPQIQRITEKKRAAALRGAHTRREARLLEVAIARSQGIQRVGRLTDRELWLVGTALHWGEGSKQNSRSPSAGIQFGNSDPRIHRIFLRWLHHLGVEEDRIRFELYIHQDRTHDTFAFRKWWANELKISIRRIPTENIYYKKGNIYTNRSNVGNLYHGLLRIRVHSSTSLNRQIEGWFEGITRAI